MKKNLLFTLSILFLTSQYGFAMDGPAERGDAIKHYMEGSSTSEPPVKRQKICGQGGEQRDLVDETINNHWISFFSRPENAELNKETVLRIEAEVKKGAIAFDVDPCNEIFDIMIDKVPENKEDLWRLAFVIHSALNENQDQCRALQEAFEEENFPDNSMLVGQMRGLMDTLYKRGENGELVDAISGTYPLYQQITEGYETESGERRLSLKEIIKNLNLQLDMDQPGKASDWVIFLRNFHDYRATSKMILTPRYGFSIEKGGAIEQHVGGSTSEPPVKRQKLCGQSSEQRDWSYGTNVGKFWKSFFSKEENKNLNEETLGRIKELVMIGVPAFYISQNTGTLKIKINKVPETIEDLWRWAFVIYFTLSENKNQRQMLQEAFERKNYLHNGRLVGQIFGLICTVYKRGENGELVDAISAKYPLYEQITKGYCPKEGDRRPSLKQIQENLGLKLCTHSKRNVMEWANFLRNFYDYSAINELIRVMGEGKIAKFICMGAQSS